MEDDMEQSTETEEISMDKSRSSSMPHLNRSLRNVLGRNEQHILPEITGERGIPIFSGDSDSSVSVTDFIERFLLFGRAYQWHNDLRARIAPLFLAGRALDYYGTLSKETQRNITEVFQALRETFADHHRARCAALELRNRRKRKNESIGEYATCLRKLARTAFPHMDVQSRSRQIVIDFILGLDVPTVRHAVLDRDPEDIDKAEEIATRITNRMEMCAALESSDRCPPERLQNDIYQARREALKPEWQRQQPRYAEYDSDFPATYESRRQSQYGNRPWREIPRPTGRPFSRPNRPRSQKPLSFPRGYSQPNYLMSLRYPDLREQEIATREEGRMGRRQFNFRPRQNIPDERSQIRWQSPNNTYEQSHLGYNQHPRRNENPTSLPEPRYDSREYPQIPTNNNQQWRPRPAATWSSDAQIQCYECHGRGHLARNCPLKEISSRTERSLRINHVQADLERAEQMEFFPNFEEVEKAECWQSEIYNPPASPPLLNSESHEISWTELESSDLKQQEDITQQKNCESSIPSFQKVVLDEIEQKRETEECSKDSGLCTTQNLVNDQLLVAPIFLHGEANSCCQDDMNEADSPGTPEGSPPETKTLSQTNHENYVKFLEPPASPVDSEAGIQMNEWAQESSECIEPQKFIAKHLETPKQIELSKKAKTSESPSEEKISHMTDEIEHAFTNSRILSQSKVDSVIAEAFHDPSGPSQPESCEATGQAQRQQSPVRRVPRSLLFSSFSFLCMFLFLCMMQNAVPTESYPYPMLCPQTVPKSLYEIEPPPPCKVPKHDTTRPVKRKFQLFKKNIILYRSPAYQCMITKRTTRTLLFLFGDERLKKEKFETLEVSKTECLKMQRTKTCRFGKLKHQDSGAYATENNSPPEFQWCCSWRVFINTNCHVIPMDIFKRHGQTDIESSGGDVSHCKYSAGTCRLRDKSRVIWTPNTKEACQFIPYKNASGSYWNKHWLSEELQLLLTFENPKEISDCDQGKLLISDQGVHVKRIFSSHKEMNQTRKSPRKETRQRRSYANQSKSMKRSLATDYDAAAKQFLSEELSNYTQHAFMAAAMNLCKHTESAFWLMKALISTQPTLAMRHLLSNDYLKAKGIGQLVEVVPCAAIKNYTFHKKVPACYENVPIQFYYAGRSRFGTMDPTTNIIDMQPKQQSYCYRGVRVVCVNDSCAKFVGKPGSSDYKEATPIKLSLMATPSMNATPLPPHTIYHELEVYNLSTMFQHPSLNKLFQVQAATSFLSQQSNNLDASQTSAGVTTFAYAQNSLRTASWLSSHLPRLLVWQIIMSVIVTIDIGIRILRFGFKFFKKIIIYKQQLVAATLQNDQTSQNEPSEPSLPLPTPSAPPLPAQLEPFLQAREAPPLRRHRDRRKLHQTNKLGDRTSSFEVWPPELSTIAASNANSKSILHILINEKPAEALFDTGSAITLISEEWVSKNALTVKKAKISAKSINNQSLPILGITDVQITLANKKIMQTVYVLRACPFDLVLGVDFMRQAGKISLDYAKGQVELNGERAALGQNEKSNQCFVKVMETIHLPPYSESRLPAKLTKPISGAILMEPKDKDEIRNPILVARVIAIPHDDTVPLRVINTAAEPKTLYKNTTLAKAEPFEEIHFKSEETQLNAEEAKEFLDMFSWPENLEPHELIQLKELILNFHSIFSKHETDLGCLDIMPHEIELTGEMPKPARPYRIPQAQQEALKQQLDALLKAGIIKPSTSPFSAPICLVKKKNSQSPRMVTDFRALNKVTRVLSYPLPHITATIDQLGSARYFSTLDLSMGFYQIKLRPEDTHKTAFSTPNGHWEYLRMPMGLASSPSSFQRAMSAVLSGLQYSTCLVYLDDVICHSFTFQEHLQRLREIFLRLKFHNLKLKPQKCHFAREEVKYLGHIISAKGLKPDPSNVEKLQNFPRPRTVKEVRTLLGIASYYRKFIYKFAEIASPLHALLKKNARFKWTEDHQKAFETLKSALTKPPILAYPDFEKNFILQTDASNEAVGAVLSQVHDGIERPVGFASRSLIKAERNYSATERECLAIVFALKYFRPYVFGRKFTVMTDHKPLRHLMEHKDPSSRLMRWAMLLQDHDMDIQYRPGNQNNNADAMSRLPQPNVTICAVTRQQQQSDLTEEQKVLKAAQEQHPLFSALMAKLQGKILPQNLSKDNRTYIRKNWESFRIRNGLLYYLTPMKQYALVLTPEFAKKIWVEVHESLFGGHFGPEKTLSRIQGKYFWPNINNDVKNWTHQCVPCELKKRPHETVRVPLHPIPVQSKPWQLVSLDIVGPLPVTKRGNRYILVITEYLTKWPEAAALKDQKAVTIAEQYIELIVSRHGCPNALLSDRGANFVSSVMKEICRLTQTQKIQTTSFHPQTDGQCERMNGTLIQTLSFMVEAKQTNWDDMLCFALMAYRASVHATTKQSPFYMLYGRTMRLPSDNVLGQPCDEERSQEDESFPEKMRKAWTLASECIAKAQKLQKLQYDKKSTTTAQEFSVNDRVYVKTPKPRAGLSPKFQMPFHGPQRIVELTDTNARVVLENKPRSKPVLVHLNRVKRAKDQSPRNLPTSHEIETDGQVGTSQNDASDILIQSRPDDQSAVRIHRPSQSENFAPARDNLAN